MTLDDRRDAKARLAAGMRHGRPWDAAVREAGLSVSRATAYRVLRRARADGGTAFVDGRSGHASKLRGTVRVWLEAYCRGAPRTPSHVIQAALAARFGLTISVSQINRVRVVLGLGSRPRGAGGKSAA